MGVNHAEKFISMPHMQIVTQKNTGEVPLGERRS